MRAVTPYRRKKQRKYTAFILEKEIKPRFIRGQTPFGFFRMTKPIFPAFHPPHRHRTPVPETTRREVNR